MWIAHNWSDYELLDCSSGEKLERWGRYTLVRPDPQVIWHTPKEHPGWLNFDARYHRSRSGGGRWEMRGRAPGAGGASAQDADSMCEEAGSERRGAATRLSYESAPSNELTSARGTLEKLTGGGAASRPGIPDRWRVSYENLTFNVSLMNFKHTGLFPEQSVNWGYITDMIRSAGRKVSVLNLFAYTGGATLSAAAAGADVCHVDAARGMVRRARENAAASGLESAPVRWIIDDCSAFVEREVRRGKRYDAIIMDPPSYGRGPGGEVWKLEDEVYNFLKLCTGLMSDDPLFVLINSYTSGLSPSVLAYISQFLLGGQAESGEIGLPVTSSGLVLPCGATCRWAPGK